MFTVGVTSQLAAPGVHADLMLNVSPMTPPPNCSTPGFEIAPVVRSTKEPGASGSVFGTIHGFTQRGWTGIIPPDGPELTLPEFDGLNASAVALAPTSLLVLPQMRAKNEGRFWRWTFTAISGLTPKTAVPAAHAELFGKVTVIWATGRDWPAI